MISPSKLLLKPTPESIQLSLEGEKASLPEPKKDYRYMTLGEQAGWYEYLKQILKGSPLLWKMERCGTQYFHWECPDCRKGKVRYNGCKERYYCPRCAYSYARGRADIQYEYLLQIAKRLPFDLKMNQLTLTLPQSLERMDEKEFIVMVKQFLKDNNIETFAYEIQHDRSKDPLGTERIHAHVLTFNFAVEDGVVGQSIPVETEYYFDLDKMRESWKSVIQWSTGQKIEGNVDLHNEYASVIHRKAQVLHILSYLYRYPVTNLFNAWRKDSSYIYLRQINARGYLERKDRLIWCGWFAPTCRRRLEELLDITLDNLSKIKSKLMLRKKKCPDCNKFYVVVDRGKYQGDNEPLL